MTLFEQALIAHLIADWLLQNDWMATNKTDWKHPAAWIHSAIHAICLGFILGWAAGIALGIFHLITDTRKPLIWWRKHFGQTVEGQAAFHVAIWSDQVVHITFIALWIYLFHSEAVLSQPFIAQLIF